VKTLDQTVRESLSPEDAILFDTLAADQALHRQLLAPFGGQLRWFNAAGWIIGLVLFAAACILGWRFTSAESLQDALRWGAAAALALAGVALVKVWFWLELQKLAIVREVRRLEVQVASLSSQLRRP
jgi:hypothetical protein